jgi:hypothetical protein
MRPSQLILPNADLAESLLFYSQPPTIDGLVVGEEPTAGSARQKQPGRCLSFDGSNDYVACGNICNYTDNFTVSLWVKTTYTTATAVFLFGRRNASYNQYLISINASKINAYVNSTITTISSTSVSDNAWHHVVVTWGGGYLKIYIDGVLDASAVKGTIISQATASVDVGRLPANAYYYPGKLFDLQVFNSALSAVEINQLYLLACNALPSKSRSLWLKCDDQHPTTSIDSSGNNIHGSPTNTNMTVGNFFYEGNDVPHSYQNDKGYTELVNYLAKSEDQSLTAPTEYYGYFITTTAATRGWKLADVGTTSGYHHLLISITRPAGLWTVSFYVKAVEYSRVGICDSGSARAWAWFDLSTGTVHSTGGAQLVSGSATITYTGDSWFRVSISILNITSYLATISMSPDAGSQTGYAANYAGTDGSGVLIDRVQINAGLLLPYQKTMAIESYGRALLLQPNYIPRDESNKLFDVFGSPLQYTGRCPNNATLINSNCLAMDGTGYLAVTGISGSETVVRKGGTSTVSFASGRINFTSGTCWDLLLSNGSYYPMAEGATDTCYDVVNAKDGVLTSANIVTARATKQAAFHANIVRGHTKYTHATLLPLYVPYNSNSEPITITPPSGYTKVKDYPAGAWHNYAESELDFTGGVASPGSGGLDTSWHPSDGVSNPTFARSSTLSGASIRMDRILRNRSTLADARLLAANKFVTTKTLP